MSAQHTPGLLRAGVSKYQGVQSFTAVSEDNEQKIVALCGLAGAADELESIANTCRLAACWNACEGLDTDLLENIATMGDTLASRFKLRDQTERELAEQRDELLAFAQEWLKRQGADENYMTAKARAAIAKAIG